MSRLLEMAQSRLAKVSEVPVALQISGRAQLWGAQEPKVILQFPNEGALLELMRNRLGDLASAYVLGRVGLKGSPRDVMTLAAGLVRSAGTAAQPSWLARMARWMQAKEQHTRDRDRAQIGFHYDVSDAFFALWLDPRRVYSCAYYPDPQMDLAQAQEAKLDLICRKLDLQKGERFLDIGAGWGGLLLWAAEHYGVRATGITLSQNQHRYVNALIAARGLEDRVQMRLCDYRDLSAETPFDKIASVGMIEHVGNSNFAVYFQQLYRLLRPGGLVLNHGISSSFADASKVAGGLGDFIDRFIFPGGELVHISVLITALARAAPLEILDVEALRPHYARTLWDWSDRLEAQLPEAEAVLTEGRTAAQAQQILRAYRLYLAGCAMTFEQNWCGLYQILAARPSGDVAGHLMRGAQSDYPFSRNYIYASGG